MKYYYKKHGDKYLKVTTEDNKVIDAEWVDKIDENEKVIYSKNIRNNSINHNRGY